MNAPWAKDRTATIMLLLSMDDRDWAMFCYGSRCEYAFNSYGQQKLERSSSTISVRTTGTAALRITSKNAASIWKRLPQESRPGELVLSAPYRDRSFPAGSSRGRRCDMAENGYCIKKATANDYVSAGLRLTEQTDRFTHKTTSSRKIERSSSSSGSSYSESGGGGSGRSGKF